MNKFTTAALGLAFAASCFAAPAFARRNVAVMLQEMPMTGTPPASSDPVNIEVKMDPATMAAMSDDMQGGKMVLVCMPGGPTIMMCHGK